jgi:hypothetical protein
LENAAAALMRLAWPDTLTFSLDVSSTILEGTTLTLHIAFLEWDIKETYPFEEGASNEKNIAASLNCNVGIKVDHIYPNDDIRVTYK